MNFEDKVVIVTGASSGIGAATAIKFASEGAKVTLVGRQEQKLRNVHEKCVRSGGKALIIVAEMTDDNDVKRILRDTLSHFGKLDVLVNNAGIADMASIFAENAMDVFDRVTNTNLRAVFYLTNLAAQYLVETKGSVVNISSVAGTKVQSPGGFAYSSSKAGLDHFSRCIALELAPKGVRVNVVSPGPVKTDIIENSGFTGDAEKAMWDMMRKTTVLDRVSDSEELADVVLYLASDKAKSITGACYVSDNGMLLKIYTDSLMSRLTDN